MLKFGNREFRNLQEQVLKNMCDIQDIEQGATVLAAFGIKVVGQVNQVSDLPAPTTYKGNLGDAFLVGTEAPYLYYIYAKAYDGQEQAAFYNLGQFPKPGPKGDTGNAAGFGTVSATATSVVGQPTVNVSTSGTNEAKNIAFEFGIPDVNPEYVEANPTAEATGTLQKLRVDNTVYSVGAAGKTKIAATVRGQTDATNGWTTLTSFSAYDNQLEKVKVGDPISVIIKHNNNILHVLNFVCVINEMPFTGMGQHFKCQGSGYCNNGGVNNYSYGSIDYASSGQDGPRLFLSDTKSSSTQHYTTLVNGDKVEIYF